MAENTSLGCWLPPCFLPTLHFYLLKETGTLKSYVTYERVGEERADLSAVVYL